MKCEICHENNAETAIGADGDGEELYVCRACAEKEQKRRRKRRERTRKAQEASVQGGAPGDRPPPMLEALINAVSDMVDGLDKAIKSHDESKKAGEEKVQEFKPLKGVKVAAPYLMRGYLHLEGLNLIGEMEAVHRAVEALGMRLEGIDLDGVTEIGHIYRLCYCNDEEQAKRTMNAIVEQEKNARIRLYEEMPRVFGDALCRALAILKNCRLLSVGEYFDLLSPLRLAAMEDMLDGIKSREIDRIMKGLCFGSAEPPLSIGERETIDAERADEANRRFEDVVVSDQEF